MFYTNLTPTGYKNADNLKYILSKLNIDKIFSSPFPRTIQTIIPYCIQNNLDKQICIEYSLLPWLILNNHWNIFLIDHSKKELAN